MANPQEIIDYDYTRVSYEFSYKTDPEQTEYAKTDLMYLDIGEKISKFYSRREQIRDSIGDEGLRKGLPVFEIMEKLFYTDSKEFMEIFLGAKIISTTNADGTPRTGKISSPFIP